VRAGFLLDVPEQLSQALQGFWGSAQGLGSALADDASTDGQLLAYQAGQIAAPLAAPVHPLLQGAAAQLDAAKAQADDAANTVVGPVEKYIQGELSNAGGLAQTEFNNVASAGQGLLNSFVPVLAPVTAGLQQLGGDAQAAADSAAQQVLAKTAAAQASVEGAAQQAAATVLPIATQAQQLGSVAQSSVDSTAQQVLDQTAAKVAPIADHVAKLDDAAQAAVSSAAAVLQGSPPPPVPVLLSTPVQPASLQSPVPAAGSAVLPSVATAPPAVVVGSLQPAQQGINGRKLQQVSALHLLCTHAPRASSE
jgi:hypothetical protein